MEIGKQKTNFGIARQRRGRPADKQAFKLQSAEIEPYINKTTPHQIYRMDETLLPQRQVEMRRKNIHKTIVSNGKTKKKAK